MRSCRNSKLSKLKEELLTQSNIYLTETTGMRVQGFEETDDVVDHDWYYDVSPTWCYHLGGELSAPVHIF